MKNYEPKPIDTTEVELPEELMQLVEKIAENVHDVWAVGRKAEGWKYGPTRDDSKKETPCMVPYDMLPESEKEFDRNTALSTIKLIIAMGYKITK